MSSDREGCRRLEHGVLGVCRTQVDIDLRRRDTRMPGDGLGQSNVFRLIVEPG